MARPATVVDMAEAVHRDLLAHRPTGGRVERPDWDRLLVKGYRKSEESARRLTATGAKFGLWTVHQKGRETWVEVLPMTGGQTTPTGALPGIPG